MRINYNSMAINAYHQYSRISANMQQSIFRLSTGLRVNSAADDPAGLAISEKMRAQIRGMKAASRNAQDAVSMVQTAEGALQETHNIVQRLRELAVQSASDTNEGSIDRAALNAEFQQLLLEIDDTANKTTYNDSVLLNGRYEADTGAFGAADANVSSRFFAAQSLQDGNYSLTIESDGAAGAFFTLKGNGGYEESATLDTILLDEAHPLNLTFSNGTSMSFVFDETTAIHDLAGLETAVGDMNFQYTGNHFVLQTGANHGDTMRLNIDSMGVDKLGLKGTSISGREAAGDAIGKLDRALNMVSAQRAQLGATQNRLTHKINNLENSIVNLSEAESRIRDLDYAEEMTAFAKLQIQFQAATAMLAQANALPQTVLQLLQNG